MAYTNYDIEAKARTMLVSELSEASDRLLRTVCAAAGAELEARLRSGVKASDIGELFVCAAGILAISMYMELNTDPENDITSFSAGSLKATLGDGDRLESAATLRKRAETMLAAYIECGGFSFTGVTS